VKEKLLFDYMYTSEKRQIG